MTRVVDSSVILALWNQEKGWQRAEEEIAGSVASSLIHAEFVTYCALRKVHEPEIVSIWTNLQIAIQVFDEEQSLAAGLLAPLTKPFGLSLADRACLVLARRLGLPVVTADRAWSKLDLGIEIRVIR